MLCVERLFQYLIWFLLIFSFYPNCIVTLFQNHVKLKNSLNLRYE